MASKIRIFRSTGATAPSSLEYGELAVTVEQGTSGTSANKAGRLFIGNASGNPVEIGGEYTYKLMDHPHGSLINSSVAIVDGSGQIDGWNVAGILTATRASITDINVSGASTVGVLTVTNNVNIGGALFINGAQVQAAGADGTFRNLTVTGIQTNTGLGDFNGGLDVSGGAGLVVSADGINVTGVSTFNNNVNFGGTIDVDGQAIFDDITVSAASTFGGVVDINSNATISGTLDVDGGAEFDDINVSAAATVGILTVTNNATVDGTLFVSGIQVTGGGAVIGDDITTRNLRVTGLSTFVGNAGFTGTIDVDGQAIFDDITVSAGSTFAGVVDINNNATVSGTLDVDGQAIFDDVAVSAAATVTGATQLIGQVTFGSGGTQYTLPTTDGAANQVLTTNGSGAVSFQEVSSTLVISAGAATTDPIDLRTETFTIAATNNETKTTLSNNTITVGLATDVIVGGGLTVSNNLLVLGNLTVEGTETIINVERLDVQDKTIGVASTSTASNTTANGGGFFVHAGSDGDKTIFWNLTQGGFEVNQDWLPNADGSFDLGNTNREWQNLFVDGLAELDDVNVSAAATINTLNVTGTGTIATADINGGAIDGTTIGAASSAAGTFTSLNYTTLTGGAIVATGSRLDAGDVTFTNLRVTGVSTVASLFLSAGTNTNGVAFFNSSGQVTSTATPSAGIQTSNFILTTNASGVPSWTDTIDGGQF